MSTSSAARPRRSARDVFSSAVLGSEAFVVFFATLVAYGLRPPGASTAQVFTVGGIGVLLCILATGMVGRRGGVVVGSVVQVPLVLSGLIISTMWVVGGLFALLWVIGLLLGARIDRERAERASQSQQAPDDGAPAA